ncbi:hypothetical protein GO755_20600 [Spirosoma sp. HMF4905]|uniref:Uncharacterized protein n=1 Tax=Spirosoma arboris TaxID=2682092 RepID=A0A7K1SF65_9BACT|nr:hypothetical protein [Spirosoma arboris]MVM32457.1 hypothetical protein [Spirosoma arboris]
MTTPSNAYLLKEYIKTLLATEVVFPGILPRRWGNEFTRAELQAIYFGLAFVIKTADPITQRTLIDDFCRVQGPNLKLHWFLGAYWRDIVQLLKDYPDSCYHPLGEN